MLYFEKEKTKIRLSIRKKGKLFTKDFSLALLIALSIHALGFVFFRVNLTGFLVPTKHPLALRVSSEQASLAIDYYEQDTPQIPAFLEVKQITSPPLSLSSFALHMPLKIKPIDFAALDLHSPYMPTQSRYYLSGGHRFLEEPSPIKGKKICKATLEFKATPDTGIIFWLNWLEMTGDPECDQEIVRVLKTAKLIPSPTTTLAMQGIIEVEFGT